MINGFELKIGNWVERTERARHGGGKSYVKVAALQYDADPRYQDFWIANDFADCGDAELNSIDMYAPIPFTIEIMEKLGFIKTPDERHVGGVELNFHIPDEPDISFSSCGTYTAGLYVVTCACRGNYFANNLEYVHQLQNLLDAIGVKNVNFQL